MTDTRHLADDMATRAAVMCAWWSYANELQQTRLLSDLRLPRTLAGVPWPFLAVVPADRARIIRLGPSLLGI